MTQSHIRNFSIIAHIDHGKSTLADRLLEVTHTLSSRQMVNQVLDDMDLEREKGITIKAHAITMLYKAKDGQEYTLNLIDTPGHVDFSYEVSRSLAACEGTLLVVDAVQGVEAQTMSNLYQAIEHNLVVIPVINKIDLPSARPDEIKQQILDILGGNPDDILLASAKEGIGIEPILERIVQEVPPPGGGPEFPLRALIFDSAFDSYRGAIAYVRVVDGQICTGNRIRFLSTQKDFEVQEVGILRLQRIPKKCLETGEVGYVIGGVKEVADTRVGDTITLADNPAKESLPGYKEAKSMVFSGIFPSVSDDYEELKESLQKLYLNDASLSFEPETSAALGFGFRCGFLGLLHMEIVQERLEREYGINIITTVPNVEYRVVMQDGSVLIVDNPAGFPDAGKIDHVEEPYIDASIITPTDYIGPIMKLALDRRGIYRNTLYLDGKRVNLQYYLPLAEIIFDFYDKLKSISRGYASFDYDFWQFKEGNLVKLNILVNGEPVDALSSIVHREKAYSWGRRLIAKLRKLIPRQLFEVVLQASIGSKILARETIKPLRKNVTAKCYGGDISRKRKLLEKQKEGKRRMKQVGSVEIPQEAFLAILQMED
ncbi:elongation factor 4 [bacterium BMS3Abin05]|nr:elongation factor 4 [bacterium BMS3Abin05]GBE27464.1 elongation factor 4 [bacterium BMS3Bbin03]HDL78971.1 elongation factor 4 [Bacteroidota bacterium]HDZ12772.1 elongation factor 4 [Bacteroidota bacterium]